MFYTPAHDMPRPLIQLVDPERRSIIGTGRLGSLERNGWQVDRCTETAQGGLTGPGRVDPPGGALR
jgi:hypothetical protein